MMDFLPSNGLPTIEYEQDDSDSLLPEWFEDVAYSIDPTRSAVYHQAIEQLKEMTGSNNDSRTDDYTYYDLPAAGASPEMFEDFE